MAYVTGFDDEEDALRIGAAPAAGAAPAPAAAPAQGAAAPRPTGTGFVNFNQMLSLNAPGGQQMAGALAGDLGQRAGVAQRAYDSASGEEAKAAAKSAGTDIDARANVLGSGDVSSLLGDVYGGSYTSGQKGLDSALAGGAAGSTLRNAAGRYGYFSSLLTDPPEAAKPGGNPNAGDNSPGGGAGPGGGIGSGGGGSPRERTPLGVGGNPLLDGSDDLRDLQRSRKREYRPYASLLSGGF